MPPMNHREQTAVDTLLRHAAEVNLYLVHVLGLAHSEAIAMLRAALFMSEQARELRPTSQTMEIATEMLLQEFRAYVRRQEGTNDRKPEGPRSN